MLIEGIYELIFGIDSLEGKMQAALAECESGQFRIRRIVFQHQNVQVFLHAGSNFYVLTFLWAAKNKR